MAYDTVKLRSPSLNPAVIEQAKNKSLRRSGVEMATGEERYVLFAGELLGSWDSRISVIPKDTHFVIDKNGRPVKEMCEPYLEIEASVHKVFFGHNVYGGQLISSRFVVILWLSLKSFLRQNFHLLTIGRFIALTLLLCTGFPSWHAKNFLTECK